MKTAAMLLTTSAIVLTDMCGATTGVRSDALIARATFNRDGSVNIPIEYRRWEHIGTRYKSIGINILDGLRTKTPEILNAYVEPGAKAYYDATGQWADGSQLVKEFTSVKTGEDCDSVTGICSGSLGEGIFEYRYVGLGLMIKDKTKFPDAPGNWGYFSFGHHPIPYDRTAFAATENQCSACHVKLASDSDYVISRAHLGLERHGDR